MANVFLVPNWFFGFDVLFELAFALITLIVSVFAFKIHKLTDQRQSKLFAISFLFISISYFLQSLLNFAVISKLNENICRAIKISDVNLLTNIEIYAYTILFIIGLVTLTYMTLKIKNKKTFSLLLIIILLSLLFNSNILRQFHLLSSILLVYIVAYYFRNYTRKKQSKTLLVLAAFIFLLFGNIHFIFSVNHGVYYVIGHFLELIAYFLILTNIVLTVRK